MIDHTLLFILGGCLLGVIQFVAGMAIGAWLRRPDPSVADRGRQDMLRASLIAKRLQDLADEMSSSVGEHRNRLDQASQLLKSENGQSNESLAEMVADVIGDMVRANQSLQSKLETAESRLEQQAAEIEAHISRSLTDPLTGLPNRREFNDRLEERMAAWNRRGEPFSLLMLDVDHFKKLNDRYGHPAGDQVLAAISRALRGAVRREDAVVRYGGEEFAILLPNTSLDQIARVVQNIHDAVTRVVVDHNGQKIAATISGGAAAIATHEQEASLIERADAALYAAKAAGRNRTFVHDGAGSCAVTEFPRPQNRPAGPADKIIAAIISSETQQNPTAPTSSDEAYEFGTYLPRETISTELAKSCEELRRLLKEQDLRQLEAAPTDRS
jgi:diguanylate cyclase